MELFGNIELGIHHKIVRPLPLLIVIPADLPRREGYMQNNFLSTKLCEFHVAFLSVIIDNINYARKN
jgi:hypothetical protein